MDNKGLKVGFVFSWLILAFPMMFAYTLAFKRLVETALYDIPLMIFGWLTNMVLFAVALVIVYIEVENA